LLLVLIAPAFAAAETVVAVGSTYGETQPGAAQEDRPLILLANDGAWHRVDAADIVAGSLSGLARGPVGRVWAFGADSSSPLLLRSADGGASWSNVSPALARVAPDQVPVAMAFRNESLGWVATRGRIGGGPQLFRTDDGAQTWTAVPDTGPRHVFGTYALRLPDGEADVVELAVSDPYMVSVRKISKDGVTVERLAAAAQIRAWTFASVKDTWWMFGREEACSANNEACEPETLGADARPDLAAIRRVDAKRAAVSRRTESAMSTDLRTGHFYDALTGVAGGHGVGDGFTPVLLRTADGGESWERGTLPENAAGGSIGAVVLTDAQSGWAAFNYVGRAGTMLLRTTDGGRHWLEVPGGLDVGHLRAFIAMTD
jgi:photosystem II stability/assembly factor-like uncharacterized protein